MNDVFSCFGKKKNIYELTNWNKMESSDFLLARMGGGFGGRLINKSNSFFFFFF